MPTDRDSDVNQDQILSIDDVISKLEEENGYIGRRYFKE